MEYGETEKQKEFNNNNDSGTKNGSFKDREIPVWHGWEIDLSKLIIKSMIVRGTFGIVHRVMYDDLDVADISDNEIHHFSLDLKGKVTSKSFSEINSISKYSAKFRQRQRGRVRSHPRGFGSDNSNETELEKGWLQQGLFSLCNWLTLHQQVTIKTTGEAGGGQWEASLINFKFMMTSST